MNAVIFMERCFIAFWGFRTFSWETRCIILLAEQAVFSPLARRSLILCSAVRHTVLRAVSFCARQLRDLCSTVASRSTKWDIVEPKILRARTLNIIYKEADSGMTAVYWTVCHVRGKPGRYGDGEAYIRV